MTYLIGTLLVIFFVYAFQGILSFVFWFFGYMWTVCFFPVEIVNQVFYPVGEPVYLVYTGLIFFLVFRLIMWLYHNHA